MNLFENERKFVSNSTDKEWISNWWDELFETSCHKNMEKFTKILLVFQLKLECGLFLIGNRLYWEKIKKN